MLEKFPQIIATASTAKDGNMSFLRGDPRQALINRETFLKSLSLNLDQTVCMRCVHGDQVLRVGKHDLGRGAYNIENAPNVDGLITNEKGVYLFLLTADCLPVMIYDPIHQAIGLVHAGWRGVDLEIIQKCVMRMAKEFQSQPKELMVEVGPSIGPCCYKNFHLTKELRNPNWSKFMIDPRDQSKGLDLWAFVQNQLREAGLRRQNIHIQGICTYHQEQYFSNRKATAEKLENDYRFATVLGLKP